MKRFNAVIVDDELDQRKKYYEVFLGEYFNLSFIGDYTKIGEIYNVDNSLIIIDRVLEHWPKNSKEILEKLNKDIPIIVVSKYWENDNGNPIMEIIEYGKTNNILLFLAWNEIAAVSHDESLTEKICESWKRRVYYEFLDNQRMYPQTVKPDECINLLQIGDLQFGGTESPYSFGDRFGLANYLKNNWWYPNFITVCGDIAESGKPSEYNTAKSWFDDFAKKLFDGKANMAHHLFVPGNHDCNFNNFAQFFYDYDFVHKKFILLKSPVSWHDSSNQIILENEIFSNYIRFINESCETKVGCNGLKHLNLVNDRFIHWGIRFIHLNTMNNIEPKNLRGEGIDEEELEQIIDYCTDNRNNLFTIIISHYGAYELGYKNADGEQSWAKIEKLLKETKTNLWLYGHRHSLEIDDIDIGKDKKVKHIATGSLRLANKKIPEKAYRGFNKIELVRKDGIVTEFVVTPYKIIGNDIDPMVEHRYPAIY